MSLLDIDELRTRINDFRTWYNRLEIIRSAGHVGFILGKHLVTGGDGKQYATGTDFSLEWNDEVQGTMYTYFKDVMLEMENIERRAQDPRDISILALSDFINLRTEQLKQWLYNTYAKYISTFRESWYGSNAYQGNPAFNYT